MLKELLQWYSDKLESLGYPLIALLMAMESSIIPLPSELVIPPAAYLAHSKGTFSVAGVIIAGTIGSWVGAAIMYWVSRTAGRPFVLRYGKYFLVPEEKVHAAERWASRFGSFGVFVARLLPVVRHLIGIPMGIVKMDFKLYSLYTIVGSAIWCSVLSWVGIAAGGQIEKGEMKQITLWIVVAVAILGAIYYAFVHRHMKAEPKK